MKIFALLGRILYSLIFIAASFGHFQQPAINFAKMQGVPYPEILVPLSGVMALLGGLSVFFGFKVRYGALLIILFLIPVTGMMHAFWHISDTAARELQQIMFLKNISMLGGAFLLLYYGAGPWSLDKA